MGGVRTPCRFSSASASASCGCGCGCSLLLRLVAEAHEAEVVLGLCEGALATLRVVRDLVLLNLAHSEVLRLRVSEHDGRHGRRRKHRHRLRQLNVRRVRDVGQVPHLQLLLVVRLRRVARRRPDAQVVLLDEVVRRRHRVERLVAPRVATHVAVEHLREALRQTVRQRLHHDDRVVVVRRLKLRDELLGAEARCRHLAHPVLLAHRRDEVAEAVVRLAVVVLLQLLAETEEAARLLRPRLVLPHDDVVLAVAVHRVVHDRALQGQRLVLLDLRQHRLRVVEELLRLDTDLRAVEQLGVATVRVLAADLPRLEEGVPVDPRHDVVERVLDHLRAEEGGTLGGRVRVEVDDALALARILDREVLTVLDAGPVLVAHLLIHVAHVLEVLLLRVAQHGAAHHHGLRRVKHVHSLRVVVLQLHRRVHLRRRRTADQERHVHLQTLELLRDRHHLVERRGDQPGESDDVRLLLLDGGHDGRQWDHDSEVDDLVVVAAQHNTDDVLADVVHVALHRRQHDLALRRCVVAASRLLRLHERNQMRHSLLHDTGALDHLRQEHLSGSEQVAHDAHARHEGTFDDVQRLRVTLLVEAAFLRVLHDVRHNALHESVLQTLLAVQQTPRVLLLLHAAAALVRLELLSHVSQHLGHRLVLILGEVLAVEDRRLKKLNELRVDVVVHRESAGVHDGHVHAARADGVLQEHRVHRHTDGLDATEGEGQVGETARDLRVRQVVLDPLRRVEEVDAVVVVLLESGRDRQHVRVEDDVLGREPDAHEHVVRALADPDLVGLVGRLADLVESHDNAGRAVLHHQPCVLQELLLARLQRDGVHNGLALHALQACLDNVEVRGVDHERQTRDVRVAHTQVDKVGHRRATVHETVVEVEVDDGRSVLRLVACDRHRRVVVARLDQTLELQRTGDVAPLADVQETSLLRHAQPLESGQHHRVVAGAPGARHVADGHVLDRADVRRPRAAAPAHDVDQLVLHEVLQLPRHLVRRLVVLAHRVGETGVRVARDPRLADVAQGLHVRAHRLRAERAVQTDREEVAVAHGRVEGLGGLSGERASGRVGDGAGDHERHAAARSLQHLVGGEECGLRVQRVEDGLDEEDVHTALEQTLDLLRVRRHQLVVRDVAELRLLDGGRDRAGPVGGTHGAADVALDAGRLGAVVGGLLADLRSLDVDAAGKVRHVVVGQRDGGRVEGVRLDHVGARVEVVHVDLVHEVRLREAQQVVVALHVAVPVLELLSAEVLLLQLVRLELRAGGAVENHDPLLQDRIELRKDRLRVVGHFQRQTILRERGCMLSAMKYRYCS
eukprot:Rhum_TRINITY_DN14653_c10_g1::Rhum_TRINITY_DN14653_c10_g1_i1::g.106929::m.106929